MPLIEFMCNKCKHRFEELIYKNEEIQEVKCPKCHKDDITKQFSTFGLCSSGVFSGNIGQSCSGCAKTSCTSCSK